MDFDADNIIDPAIAEYLNDFAGESPSTAKAMEEEAARRDFPIVGPVVGRFLSLFAGAIEPDRILELGSGFGYSAFWFARGTEDTRIQLTDYDVENLDAARAYLEDPYSPDRFEYHKGDALEIANDFTESIDFVFVDLDKEGYPAALETAEDLLDTGGWLVADNVLWDGQVADESVDDEATQAIRTFNDRLREDPWESSILPIRDGIALAQKIPGAKYD